MGEDNKKKSNWNFSVDDVELTQLLTKVNQPDPDSDSSIVIKKDKSNKKSKKKRGLALDFEAAPARRSRRDYESRGRQSKKRPEDDSGIYEVKSLATLSNRFVAFTIDLVLFAVIVFVFEKFSIRFSEKPWFLIAKIAFHSTTYFLYYVLPLSVSGATLGKKAASVRVITIDGESPSLQQAFVREVLMKPISIILVVGVALAFINRPKRTLYDLLSGTIVVES